jgi:acetyl-CoA synthetase
MLDVEPRIERYTYYFDREWDSYEEIYEDFEWEIPEQFNHADYICDRWAQDKSRVAIFSEDDAGNERVYTYWQLSNITNQLANYLAAHGVEEGDRVGINTPQKPETIIAHIATWKLGAVSVPLSTLFGPDGLRYRLDDCDAKVCIGDETNIEPLRDIVPDLPALETVLTVDEPDPRDGETDFWEAIEGQPRTFENVDTRADDDAIIIYTSGTTGDPKGALHGHDVLLSVLPVIATMGFNLEYSESDLTWTPSEWSWVGPMYSVLFPSMYYGKPILSYHTDGTFDPEKAFELIEKYGVTFSLLPPTAIRMMMKTENPGARYDLSSMRVVESGGGLVGKQLEAWVEDEFEGAVLHQAYGQTEVTGPIMEVTSLFERKDGTLGRPTIGYDIAIVDPETAEETVETGDVGEIAVRYDGNPACFDEYWNKPEKTAQKVQNGWCLTEDLGAVDEDGYFTFHGRKDDVIMCAGYKVGPEEVEDSLASHEAVDAAGVIGIPDDKRGEIPKAFVVLADGISPSPALTEELQSFVKENLAKYEYPRAIEFVDELPRTTTGKIQRYKLRKREGVVDEE